MSSKKTVLVALALGGLGAMLTGCGGSSDPKETYRTPDEVLKAAPPVWRPDGDLHADGSASFRAPAGWTETLYDDGTAVRSPEAQGGQCEIFVLAPRPASAGDDRYAQLLDAALALFPDGTQVTNQYGGDDLMAYRWRGDSARGFTYVGLTLKASGVDVLPLLADFSGTAVPVVVVEPGSSPTHCLLGYGDFDLDVATVFHSLTLGPATATSAVADALLGEWSSSDGSVGSLYVWGANGHYVDASAVSGVVPDGAGNWQDATASWSGNGQYVIRGDVLGLFPEGGTPESHYVRHLEMAQQDGSWKERMCLISALDGAPYTHCLDRQE